MIKSKTSLLTTSCKVHDKQAVKLIACHTHIFQPGLSVKKAVETDLVFRRVTPINHSAEPPVPVS